MSALGIYPGYIGYATIDVYPESIRCTDFSVNVKQDPLFYDHVIGLRDSIPTLIYETKGDIAARNKQKIIWRPSVKLSQGNFGFNWTDNNPAVLWNEVRTGDSFNMKFFYACDALTRKFDNCKVNSYTLKIANGEIISSSTDIIAIHMDNDATARENVTTTNKLVTWDAATVSIAGVALPLVYFECTVANNCIPIYTQGSLEPFDIRIGMQMVTGTLAYYDKKDLNWMEDISGATLVNVVVGDLWQQNFNVVFSPIQQSADVSATIRTYAFTGVDDALPDVAPPP